MSSRLACLGLVWLAACGSTSNGQNTGAPKPHGKSAASDSSSVAGDYQCRITVDDHASEAPCRVSQGATGLTLEMAQGLGGLVTPNLAGFRLRGKLRCNASPPCNDSVDAQFFRQGEGVIAGTFALEDGRLVDVVLAPLAVTKSN